MKSSGMKMYMSKTWVVFVCALVCCFLWGSAFPCIKIGYSLFSIGASDSGVTDRVCRNPVLRWRGFL